MPSMSNSQLKKTADVVVRYLSPYYKDGHIVSKVTDTGLDVINYMYY